MITSPPRKSCRVIIQAAASRPKCSGGCRLSRLRGPRLHRDSLAARAIAPSRARLIPPAPFRIAAAASRSKTSRPPAPTRAPRSSAARPAAGWPRTTTRPSPSSLRRYLSRPLNGLRGRHCFTSQISFPSRAVSCEGGMEGGMSFHPRRTTRRYVHTVVAHLAFATGTALAPLSTRSSTPSRTPSSIHSRALCRSLQGPSDTDTTTPKDTKRYTDTRGYRIGLCKARPSRSEGRRS